MTDNKKINFKTTLSKTGNALLKLILFFITWFLISGLAYLPIFFFYPDIEAMSSQAREDEGFLIVYGSAMLVGTFLSVYIFQKFSEKKPFSALGLDANIPKFLGGAMCGFLIIGTFTFIVVATGIVEITYTGISSTLFLLFIHYCLVALIEEFLCRGFILSFLETRFGAKVSIVLSSFIFAMMHIFNNAVTWIGLMNIFLSGILLAIAFLKTRKLSYAIGWHFGWNFFQGPIFGFAVSGHNNTSLFSVTPLNDVALTGGRFGAEGSVLITVLLIVVIVFMMIKTHLFRQQEIITSASGS